MPIPTIPESATPMHHEYDIGIDGGDGVYYTSDDGIDSPGTTGFMAPVTVLPGVILDAICLCADRICQAERWYEQYMEYFFGHNIMHICIRTKNMEE